MHLFSAESKRIYKIITLFWIFALDRAYIRPFWFGNLELIIGKWGMMQNEILEVTNQFCPILRHWSSSVRNEAAN